MKKQKLIFLNRFFYPDHSATSQLLSDLVLYLRQQGHEVHVITNSRKYGNSSEQHAPYCDLFGIKVYRVWTSCLLSFGLIGRVIDYLSFYLTAGWQLFKVTRRGDVIIALTDPPMISVICAFVAKIRGAKLVNWLQDLFPEIAIQVGIRGFNGLLGKSLKKLRNLSLHSAECNVVLGRHMESVLNELGIPQNKIKTIPNWADGKAITPIQTDANPLRREWGLDDKFVIAYSGNLGRAHEYNTLLEAAESLREHKNIIFLFIGSGFLRAQLAEDLQQLHLDNILFKPYQPREKLSLSLGIADIHWVSLLPELEGLIVPSKFYGILAAARPTLMVGDPHGEVGKLLTKHDCGFAVKIGDSDQLVEQILFLTENPLICRKLGKDARKLFDDKFTQSKAFSQWHQVIKSALNLCTVETAIPDDQNVSTSPKVSPRKL